jgi:5-methylcytosine-specific restriction endonuclease McrA
MFRERKTLVGNRYNRLLVVERLSSIRKNKVFQVMYRCLCDCGVEVTKPYGNLYSGNTGSCGCLSLELKRARKVSDEDIRLHEIGRYYRRNAQTAGRKWDLSESDLLTIVSNPCTYCGDTGVVGRFIGVDRVDSSKGYTLTNVTPCCRICNQAKSSLSVDEFKTWVKRVHQHLSLGENGEHP